MHNLLFGFIAIVVLIFVSLLGIFWSALKEFGASPSGARLERIQASPQYDPSKKKLSK